MRVDIYSDISCPWCYMATIRFDRALAGFTGIQVAHQPFQLNPAMPLRPQPLLDYYEQRYGTAFRDDHAAIADLAAAEGIALRMDRAQAVNTLAAHRLVWLAEHDHDLATQHAVAAALLHAYFVDGANIADLDTLVALAETAGMNPDQTRRALAGDLGVSEVRAAIANAQALGINAVPTFVFNATQALQGARTVSTYQRVLAQLSVADSAAPTCSDGTCVV